MLAQPTVHTRLLVLALLPLTMILVMTLALTNAGQLNQRFQECVSDRMQPISPLTTIADV